MALLRFASVGLCALSFACTSESSSGDSTDAGASGGSASGGSASGTGGRTGTGGGVGAGGRISSGGAASDAGNGAGGAVGGAGGAVGTGGVTGAGGEASTGGASAEPCARPKPGPDTTGVPAGTVLTPSGSITVEEDGAVVEDLEIDGSIIVLANDVTIRRVRLTSGDYYPIRYFDEDNTGLVVEDSEIIGTSGDVTSAIAFANYTARRLNVHGMADGFKADSNVLIEDSWVHDLSNGNLEHNDAVQSTGGAGVTIRHNVLGGASNACVQTGDEGAATEDLVVECNWLDGGGYALNIRGAGDTRPRNTRVVGNRFGRGSAYGPWVIDDPSPVVTGNVWDDDGAAIPYP